MKKLIVLLAMLGASAGIAHADGFVTVTASGTFTGQDRPGEINFSMVSIFDTTTMQIGTTAFAEADTFGLGAFTPMLFGGADPVWNFVDSHGDMLQIDPNQIIGPEPGPLFPQLGQYANDDVILICGLNSCNGSVTDRFQNGGSLTVSAVATPEPSSLLLLSLALVAVALLTWKKLYTYGP